MDANEKLFETYLKQHSYGFEFEPPLPTRSKPDFSIWRDPAYPVICEVEGFSEKARPRREPQAGRRLVSTGDPHKLLTPLREHIKTGAKQLRELKDSGMPLVVVLANAYGADIRLGKTELLMAIDGDPRIAMAVDRGSGASVAEWYDPRHGKARDHLYLSAIVAVHPSLAGGGHSSERFVELVVEQLRGGQQPAADVIKFVDGPAVPLPDDFFDGRFDRVWEYSRVTGQSTLVRGG